MSTEPPPPANRPKATDAPAKNGTFREGTYTRKEVTIGIVGTILAHIWFFFLLSSGWFDAGELEVAEDPYTEFSIELEVPEEPEEQDQFYTQTNPDVPENEPDQTNRFGARSQQAANEELPDELDPENRPATESDDLIETDQFLSGSLQDPVLAPPPAEQPAEQPVEEPREEVAEQQPPSPNSPLLVAVNATEEAQRKEIPLFGSQDDNEDESGITDYDYEKLEEPPTNVTELVEGEEEEGEVEKTLEPSPQTIASTAQPQTQETVTTDGIPSPKPRPQLPRVAAGPTRDSRLGVSSVGQLAVDAKASKFGEYMERLIETVSLNWDDLVQRSSGVERKSMVKIRFMLTKHGEVSDIEILEGTTSRAIGIYMCREAIIRGVPFGPWPPGLVDMFGDEEDVTFTFHYRTR